MGTFPVPSHFRCLTTTNEPSLAPCISSRARTRPLSRDWNTSEFVRQAKELHASQPEPLPLVVHCWRGGMRSGSVSWLLETAGLDVIKIEGGYKAYRAWARDDFASIPDLRILGGMTGVGKTQIIKAMRDMGAQVVDLEGRAGHLGSAFGNLSRTPQPTSEQFSNDCHKDVVVLDPERPIWMENAGPLERCTSPRSCLMPCASLQFGLW